MSAHDFLGDGSSSMSVGQLYDRVTPPDEFGAGIVYTADYLDMDPLLLACQAMIMPSYVMVPVKDNYQKSLFLPGHTLAGPWGPSPAEVMIVGKMPWSQEQTDRRLFLGNPETNVLMRSFEFAGLNFHDWYITNVVRFMPPDYSKNLKATWIKECQWMLHTELDIVKPKHLLLLGADAIKFFFGRKASLSKLRGAETLEYQGIKVHVTAHPAAVARDPDQEATFQDDIRAFAERAFGAALKRKPVSYREITTRKELKEHVAEMLRRGCNEFAVDCEWGGLERSDFISGQLRTIQWSPRPREAYCLVLRKEGLVDAFDDMDAVPALLRELFCRDEVKIHGHNFRSDLKWLVRLGVDVTEQHGRGMDTITAYHLLDPAAAIGYKLENIGVKYTDLGRYDLKLQEWLADNKYGRKNLDKHGYAFVPAELLHPYSMCDVDLVSRLVPIFTKGLKNITLEGYGPYEMNGTRVETMYDFYRALVHPAFVGINEVETWGINADKTRLLGLVDLFHERLEEMAAGFKTLINWPDFNFRSVYQVRELLYGYRDATARLEIQEGKRPKKRAAPRGALCLALRPIKSTGKPSYDWDRVPPQLQDKVEPSTDSESLQIFASKKPVAKALADLRFIDQICKGFLRKPDDESEDDGVFDEDVDDESFADISLRSSGLVGAVMADGRVHTSISQLTETGRQRSCVHADTLLETKRGLIPIKDVVSGDEVWTHRNRWRKVLETYVHPPQQMYDVTLSNGEVLTCTENHRVLSCAGNWEEILNAVSMQEAHAEQESRRERGEGLQDDYGYSRGDCRAKRSKHGNCESHDQKNNSGRQVQDAEEVAVPYFSPREAEPELRESASEAGLRGRPGLPDTAGEREKALCTPDRVCGDAGYSPRRSSGEHSNTPHRRGPEEQPPGQPGRSHERRPQDDSRAEQADSRRPRIEEVKPSGVYPVHDIWVDEDNSYSACNLFHHNSSPNMQNIPKKQEAQLKRCFSPDPARLLNTKKWDSLPLDELKRQGLLHPKYYSIRSCFTAEPGYILIEADYVQAELNILARISGDENLIDATSDPTRDLHSELAVKGLGLPCDPSEVKDLFKTKRDGTKAVVYGILYGRGANAVVRSMQKEGILDFSVSDADALKEALFGECPLVYEFIQKCHRSVYSPGYVETPFGRRRYFRETYDEAVRKEQERKAVNHPIQGTVADALHLALINSYYYRDVVNIPYRVILPVHDALFYEAPIEAAYEVYDNVVPVCMHDGCEIPHLNFKLGIDREVSYRWGEKCKIEEAIALSKKAYRIPRNKVAV